MVFRKLLYRLKSTGVISPYSPVTIAFFVGISKVIFTIANPPPPLWDPMIEDEDTSL